MHLYLITQTELNGPDTYDSAVVAAPDAETAKHIHPTGSAEAPHYWSAWGLSRADTWPDSKYVEATFLGIAAPHVKQGVICASFNAG